jgi:hypothetical protein
MNQAICAKVNLRLLTKADRLFTGTIEGRIIELLQNARRAGATEVRITNTGNLVTIHDNGCGIEDFQKLLDLGSSGWDEQIESGEDPAGVGLFCLAPRQVTISSGHFSVAISPDGWTGVFLEVTESQNHINGTKIEFANDKPWDLETVEKHAVFAGIRVIVDGKYCHSMPFCGNESALYDDLGCRIEVTCDISKYHKIWPHSHYFRRVLVNFHGQVVEMDYWPGDSRHNIYIFVNLTEQTQIRLMLPARTCLVQNAALEQLKKAVEIEYFRYFQGQKEHSLFFSEYLRGKQLGIDLPEAQQQYTAGLIHDSYEMAIQVFPPKDFILQQGYLCPQEMDDCDTANAHLLAALGQFEKSPFVPVTIDSQFIGYSWTKLPQVTKVRVNAGEEILRHGIKSGDLVCVKSLAITVETFGQQDCYFAGLHGCRLQKARRPVLREYRVCLCHKRSQRISGRCQYLVSSGWIR